MMYKKILAALLSVVIVLSLAACHGKNETVVSFDSVPVSDTTETGSEISADSSAAIITLTDFDGKGKTSLQIPSGLYLLYQTYAFSAFVSEVNDAINGEYSVTNYNKYMEYTLDGKTAKDWINEKTLEYVKKYAAIEVLFGISELSFGTTESSTVASAANQWQNNYGDTYEKNGVGISSYKLYYTNYIKESQLFAYYYDAENSTTGLGGKYEVSDEELKSTLADNYIIEQQLSISTKGEDGNDLSDTKIKAVKAKLDAYAKRINTGKATFDQISAENSSSSYDAKAVSVPTNANGDKSLYPSTVTLLSSKDSDTTNYDKFKAMTGESSFKYDTAFVTGGKEDGSYYLNIVYNIAKDYKYYTHYSTTQYDQSTGQSYNVDLHSTLLSISKWDSFEDMLIAKADTFGMKQNQELLDFYSPEKLDFNQD